MKQESPAEKNIVTRDATTSVPPVVETELPSLKVSEKEEITAANTEETVEEPSFDGGEQEIERFTVKFAAKELTWIKITADAIEPFEIMLRSGETYSRSASETMKVRIGNAGGLAIFFNDVPLGTLGERGTTLNLEFPEVAENFKILE